VSHDCACTRPIQDTAVVCPHCGFQLDAALGEITVWLARELDITLSKQTRIAVGHGAPQPEEPQAKTPGTLKPTPSPFHRGASAAATRLKGELVTWARVVREGSGAELPGTDTIAVVAAWLRPRVGWLRYHEASQEAVDGICSAVDAVWRIVDRPADMLFAGPCNECDQDLYAHAGAQYVRCHTPDCGQIYQVEERRRWLLEALDDHLVNATHASRLLTYLGITLASNSVRMYASKGRIVPHGMDRDGNPTYRLGDVVRTYYTPRQKAS
jgi:hypothetical protein